MSADIIDGNKTASLIRAELAEEITRLKERDNIVPGLAVVLVGENPASQVYVRMKNKSCREIGIYSEQHNLKAQVSETELLALIDKLNEDPRIHGILMQLPLPDHIDESRILCRIIPEKDVDGFHPVNLGRMVSGLPAYLPATPYGIVQLLERYNIETEGKHCVVLGRSNIVGTPVSILLSRKANPGNCTVTLCHSKTKDIKEWSASADILIAAIGQKEFVTADMVKENAVVIDVGIHRVASTKTKSGFRLKGDVKFDEVAEKCSYITPVPGGVGPMTITGLLQNTLKAFKKEIYN